MKLSFNAFIIATMIQSATANFDCSICDGPSGQRSTYPTTLKQALEAAQSRGDVSQGTTSQPALKRFIRYLIDNGGLSIEDNQGLPQVECWDLTGIDSLRKAFELVKDTDLNGVDLNCWDTSEVTDMTYAFGTSDFQGSLDNWDTSKVTDMSYMFVDATSFNSQINHFNIAEVTSFNCFLNGAAAFDQPLDSWDTSKVTDMNVMFRGTSFDQDVTMWNTENVENMNGVFGNSPFDQNLSAWNVSKVTSIQGMFHSATSFNQNLSGWDVSKVEHAGDVFKLASMSSQCMAAWDDKIVPGEGYNGKPNVEDMFMDSGACTGPNTPVGGQPDTWCKNTECSEIVAPPAPVTAQSGNGDDSQVGVAAATAPLGRFEILHPTSGDIATVPTADLDSVEGVINFRKGTSVVESQLGLELYGMIGKSPAGDNLECGDGELLTSTTGFKDTPVFDMGNNKVTSKLDLTQATTVTSTGSQIIFCASIKSSVTRLETLFTINYTFESGTFGFSLDVADPAGASALATISEDQTIPIEAFLCDADKDRLLIANPVRVGQGK